MSREWETQAAIYVDENHIYQVDLGAQPEVKWKQGELSLRVQIPYDGQLPYADNQQLKDVPENQDQLVLGRVTLASPNIPQSAETIQVLMPAGKDLQTQLKSGRQLVIHRNRPLSEPQNTLITVDGKVSDDTDEKTLEDRLKNLSIEQLDDFANKLRLQLKLAAPNLFEERRQEARARELREILLEQESDRQIPFPKIDDLDQLAQSLAALANRPGGGRIVVGMNRGQVVGLEGSFEQKQIEELLLKAALRCTPTVPFFSPEDYMPSAGKMIACVVVPAGLTETYQCNGTVFRRVGTAIVQDKPSSRTVSPAPTPPIANLEARIKAGNTADVIILDANNALGTLPLGRAICGLINADRRDKRGDQRDGLILICNLGGDSNILQRLTQRLREELAKCLPRMQLQPEIVQVNQEQIGLIHIPGTLAPVALYDDQGYIWINLHDQGRERAEFFPASIGIDDVIALYHERTRTGEASAGVQMVYGEVNWPIQPADAIEANNGVEQTAARADYDIQRHTMVWHATPFEPERDTNWLHCELMTPLRDALIQVADDNKITSIAPILRGILLVRFNNLLASGLEITPHMPDGAEAAHDSGNTTSTTTSGNKDWFRRLPIYKSTNIRLEVTMYTQELFKRRSRMSRLHFRVPDVSLDQERVADIRQACADLGFQIYEVEEAKLSNGVTSWTLLKGIRNKGFCDIRLFVGIVRSNPEKLTRELRYRQRTDSKTIQASLLDIGVWLWGSGNAAAKEIASLHIGLYDILSQRLHHLRTE